MNQPFRLRLDEILKERRMTQKALAAKAGLSENAMTKLVNNPRQVRIATIGRLADVLEISVEDLFTRVN